MKRINVLGVQVDAITKQELETRLDFKSKTVISKLNAEFLQRSLKDGEFALTLNKSDINIADGRGVLWAAKYLSIPVSEEYIPRVLQSWWQMIYSGAAIVLNPRFISYPIPESIPGVEALDLMVNVAVGKGAGVFIFGATQKALDKAIVNLQRLFPGLKVSGSLNGYDYQNDPKVDPIVEINKTDAKLLIVALGSPKQEYWIRDNMQYLENVKIIVGEGGTLDRVANPLLKSPKWINRVGLEWLWRLLFNKSQMGSKRNRLQRFWDSVPVFIYEVVKYKISNA